jgi:type I restriction enzyme, S subunit
MPIDFHHDGLWELPEGWVWTRLNDICKYPGRIDPAKDRKGQFQYIDLSAVDAGKITQPQILPVERAPSRARQPVRARDTLLSCVRVYLRTNAFVSDELDGSVASTAFCVLRPGDAIDPQYLFWFVQSRKFTNVLIPLQRGNSPPAVLDDDVRDQLIPIAPLAEQRRVVARIDELFTEIADGEAALARARNDLNTWRRALLKAAVTGELTREWRNEHNGIANGIDFLAELRSEKIRESARIKKRGFMTRAPSEELELPALPASWTWGQLGDLLFNIEAGLNVKAEGRPPTKKEVGIVKISAVTWDEFDETESKTLPSNTPIDEGDLIKPGDLLISRANTLELVGAPVIVKSCDRRLVLSDKVLRLRIVGSLYRWVELCLKSPLGRHLIEYYASGNQLSMRNITQENIARLAIPIPPRGEIETIIKIFEDSVECRSEGWTAIEFASRSSTSVRQSILKAAFEGRLVEQDSRDEPAEVMLARLNSEAGAPVRPARSRKAKRLALTAE